jgi:hypothetical protein
LTAAAAKGTAATLATAFASLSSAAATLAASLTTATAGLTTAGLTATALTAFRGATCTPGFAIEIAAATAFVIAVSAATFGSSTEGREVSVRHLGMTRQEGFAVEVPATASALATRTHALVISIAGSAALASSMFAATAAAMTAAVCISFVVSWFSFAACICIRR